MMRHLSQNFLRAQFRNIETIRKLSQNKNMNDSKTIAVCQMTSTADKAANYEVVSDLVREAATGKAEMIFFPEACDYICDNKKDISALAEPIVGGETVNKYRKLAAEHNVWLSMGGLHEKDDKNPTKVYNTHVIIDNKGSIVQTYRKLHLFDVEIPEKNVRLKESDFCTPGAHIVTPVDTPIGRIGMAICYDMRFPEFSTQLALLGADVLTFPSAFTHTTGEAHWEILLRSRAIENQCYVIAAAQVGHHNAKRRSYGRAMCVDPWGDVLADCGTEATPCCRLARTHAARLKSVRANMPVALHRRKDVYSLYAQTLRNHLLPEHETMDGEQTGRDPDQAGRDPDRSYRGKTHVFGHVAVPDSCVFYKSDLTYAFVNLRCVIPGHVLVAPVRLAERNIDLTEEEATDFYKTIRIVQKLMERVHSTNSCTVTIQDGPEAGQTVKHLHCHIMPRKKGDFIDNDLIYLELAKHDQTKVGHPGKPARTLQEMESEAELLREELKKISAEGLHS